MTEFKLALRDFLLRRHPDAVDKLELVSLRFSMSRDIGENRYREALRQLHTWVLDRTVTKPHPATPGKGPEGPDRSLLRVDDLFLVVQVCLRLGGFILFSFFNITSFFAFCRCCQRQPLIS